MNDSLSKQELLAIEAGAGSGRSRRAAARVLEWVKRRLGSLLILWLPTLLATIYYFGIAADRYESEARFVVREASHAQASGLSSLLQSSGVSRAQDEVFSVHDFVLSRDAMTALERKIDLRAIFNRPESDFLARYPNLVDRDNSEDFFKYYQRRVDVIYDTTTGISTLTVQAFRAKDAQMLADLLLAESEDFINRMNERAHGNAMRDAEADVALAEDRVTQAQQSILGYRNREAMLDPAKTSGAMFETLAKLQAELTSTKTRLAELDRTSPGSPLRSDLETHANALQKQIEGGQARLAGSDESMAPKISEYERLTLRQEFASKELTSALASLEAAREEARKQQIYLDRVVEPDLPDRAEALKPFRMVITIFISLFMIYSIGKLLIAGVQEHSQK